jgi:signal transduction histidine kinase
VRVSLAGHGQRALLEVEDDGIGVPTEERGRLFERFFRASTATERAIAGTGLGLAITRTIVEAHGGQIAADKARSGRGTRFSVTLPLGVE